MRSSRLVPLLAAVAVLLVPLLSAPSASAAITPAVTAVANDRGTTAGGTFVTLRGTNFTGVHTVAFGSTKTKNFRVWSSTEMTVRVPKHGAGTVYVRVALPGKASAASTRARYRYLTPTAPTVLRPTGAARPAPPVADTQYAPVAHVRVDLSCSSADFCGAVGDRGLSTWDGQSWSAPVSVGSGNVPPRISCDGRFCMAYTADQHRWRYQDGAWTDLGALAGMRSLSCVAASGGVCIAQAGQRAYLYRDGAWSGPQNVVSGGVAGTSCTPTGCVVTSRTSYWRTYDHATDTWAAQRPMYASSALRTSSLTRGVTGELQCTSPQWCLSLGAERRPRAFVGYQRYAVLTGGQAWSIASERTLHSLNSTTQGDTRVTECADGRCLAVAYATHDHLGDEFREWVVFDGVSFTPAERTSPTLHVDALSCWGVPGRDRCRGFAGDAERDVTP